MLKSILQDLNKSSKDPQVLSYQALRRAVGWLGILLPVVLVLGSFVFGKCGIEVQPTISHYYYTNMREVFEGVLCAVALFLFSYKGFSKMDIYATNLAGLFALGVAMFPTNYLPCFNCQTVPAILIDVKCHPTIHLVCASLFFITLACISFFLFTKTSDKNKPTKQKLKRNVIYRVCGIVMWACIIVIAIYMNFIKKHNQIESQLVLGLETLALWAFGLSWLTKGETLLKDKKIQD